MLLGLILWSSLTGQSGQLGDLDGDEVATVRDIALLVDHFRGFTTLNERKKLLADVTGDGAINQRDADAIVNEILGTTDPLVRRLSIFPCPSPWIRLWMSKPFMPNSVTKRSFRG